MKKKYRNITSILLLLPSIIAVGIFIYGFILSSFYISTTDWGQGNALSFNPDINFIGLKNYFNLFTNFISVRFRQDLVNAVFYSLILVSFTIVIGFLLAVMLDRNPRGESFFRTLFLYPMALSFVASGTIWRWLLAPNGGINILPTTIGLPKIDFLWISSRESILKFNWQNLPTILLWTISVMFFVIAMIYLIKKSKIKRIVVMFILSGFTFTLGLIMIKYNAGLQYEEIHGFNLATIGVLMAAIWQYSGYTMALFLAGLRSVPSELKDAVEIDGASQTRYYLSIAIPYIWPIALSAVIILSHISLKIFDLIYTISGADNSATSHPSVTMYLNTFRGNDFASGAAISVILFVFAALFILPYIVYNYIEGRKK